MGLLSQLVFYAVQTAGALIDTARGMDQPAFVSAQLPGNISALGNFQFQAALVLFLWMRNRVLMCSMFDAIRSVPQPTIASVFGFALGGGFESVLSSNVIIAEVFYSFTPFFWRQMPAGTQYHTAFTRPRLSNLTTIN